METLYKIANFVSEKINSAEISLSDYVTTDNLLPNKAGITLAVSLPAKNTKLIKYQKGDVLISNIRPYLKKIWLADKSGGCSNDILVFRAKEKNNSDFLHYVLFQDAFFDFMMCGAKGTKMPRGDKSQIMRFLVPDVSSSTQPKIAQILSTLDRKIALNQQINHQLEKMAKTLYDYWFVQFDFPDENGKPYKSSGGEMIWCEELKREVPKGWVYIKIKDIIELKTGKEDANFATENGKYPFFTCSEQISKCDEFAFDERTILLAGNGSFSVKKFQGKFNAYQRTYIITPKLENLYMPIYFLIKDNVKKFTSGSRGSIIKFITKGDIENLQITIPKNKDVNFAKTLLTIFEQQMNLEKETHTLTEYRDFLLPMLMNSQVEIQ